MNCKQRNRLKFGEYEHRVRQSLFLVLIYNTIIVKDAFNTTAKMLSIH